MLYQKDAHLYRKRIRQRQRNQRAKGASFLILALLLMFYAVPCFATSIWDEGLSDQSSGTVFSTAISDNLYEGEAGELSAGAGAALAAEEAAESAVESTRAASKIDPTVSDTTGPGILSDDAAVQSAKKRAQAVYAATAEKEAQHQQALSKSAASPEIVHHGLLPACIAFSFAVIFMLLGMRSIVKARRLRAEFAFAAYGNALKA